MAECSSGRTGVVETTFAKLGACSRQYVVSRVTRSKSVPVPGRRDRGDTVTQMHYVIGDALSQAMPHID